MVMVNGKWLCGTIEKIRMYMVRWLIFIESIKHYKMLSIVLSFYAFWLDLNLIELV